MRGAVRGLAARARPRGAARGGAGRRRGRCCSALLLGGFALAVDFPKAAYGFQSDEASYYTLGHSLARDGDFAFDRGDLARVYQEFPTGPEGIFLKKGRTRWIERRSGFPWIGLAAGPDTHVDRLYFGKSFAYPLAAAPFVWLFGTSGFLVLHAVLLSLSLLAAYWFLRARSEPAAALAYAAVFFVASAAPVYFVWITPEIFNLSLGVLGLFCGLYRMVSPERAARRRLVEPLPARRRRAAARRGDHRRRRLLEADQRRAGGADRRPRRCCAATGGRLPAPRVAFVLSCGGLFGLNLATSGEVNYQGGERATYYEAKGFPFMTAAAPTSSPLTQTAPAKGGGAVGLTRGVDSVLWDIVLSRNSLVEVFPANLVYFVLGRHSGLVPYFFPGVLSVLLFLAWRGGRPWFQWITLGDSRRRQRGAAAVDPVHLLGRRRADRQPLLHGALPAAAVRHAAAAQRAAGDRRAGDRRPVHGEAGAEPVLRELPAGRARQARPAALAADREEPAERPADQRHAGARPHPARRRAADLGLLPRRQRLPAGRGVVLGQGRLPRRPAAARAGPRGHRSRTPPASRS